MCAPHSLTHSLRYAIFYVRLLDHRSCMLIAGSRWLCLADRLQIGVCAREFQFDAHIFILAARWARMRHLL